MDDSHKLKLIYEALEDKKANDIKVIDIKDVSSVGEYLVIADGNNPSQVQAMYDSVEEAMFKVNAKLKSREGNPSGGWVLLDYYDVIVHIFAEEQRSFYNLEHLWRDGKPVDYKKLCEDITE